MINGSDLVITWELPKSHTPIANDCWEYEVLLRDQEKPQLVKNELSYIVPNVDLTQRYKVKVRTRIDLTCYGSGRWSDWSETDILVPTQSPFQLNAGVIVVISLIIPMILLALLLLVCQRVSKRLFPPIPSPPQKYLHAMQNTDAVFCNDLMKNSDEEITFVFCTEDEKPHKI